MNIVFISIVVTAQLEEILEPHAEAIKLFGENRVSELCASPFVGYMSFFVCPLASKNKEDTEMSAFKKYLNALPFEFRPYWTEVKY